MQTRGRELFTTVRTEGAILPPDLLRRVLDGDRDLGGLRAEDYHLAPGERLNEATNRAWNRLQGAWSSFRDLAARLPTGDPGTTVTRERWLLPLFQELGYGRLAAARAIERDGKSYAVSHARGDVPIHLVGCNVDLDRRTAGLAGAARSSPHSLVQELLNASDEHLWGFVSNGRRLRILRDNTSLTRQAYVEFDLEAMFEGEVYADFVLLWLLAHESRVEAARPEECWLERWSQAAEKQGIRALDGLRNGVQAAIEALGRGFLAHRANGALRERLRSGALDTQEYYRQVLRLVYRLLFLFAAEDRGLLLDPAAPAEARARYSRYYATERLRRLAGRRAGSRHSDLWQGLRLVMAKLGKDGCPELGLPALGGFLFGPDAAPDLDGAEIANFDLLDAVRALAYTSDGGPRRAVDYKNLGAEEIGSVYESLLELHPTLHVDAGTFTLGTAAGHERKTTGSYYTPASLIQALCDSALDPVLDEAAAKPDPEAAILDLKICDPAAGSGHFLIAAAHRLARRLAAVRTGEAEPAPEALRSALRDVIGRCLYGVDLNPMAVELCKVALWMEALEPGKPLSFLDHHIQCGNSLLGATPALLAGGIPDAAFEPIEGDDRAYCREYRKLNQRQRAGQRSLFHGTMQPWERLGDLAAEMLRLDAMDDRTIAGQRAKQERYERLVRSEGYLFGRLRADAWCAAFVWKKDRTFDYPITEEVFRKIERNPYDLAPWMRDEIARLAARYRFFHWHLAFPDVFRLPADGEDPENEQAGWSGGFDVVLGNPPWERIKLQEKEWFASRRPEIAAAANADRRKKLIEALAESDPATYNAFLEDRRRAEGESHFVRDSGRFPLCGRGDVNTYAIFAETNRMVMGPAGRVGCILPSGIATDDTTRFFFQDLMDRRALVSLYDFENREKIFPAVDSRMKFCLLTLTGGGRPQRGGAEFAFFLRRTEDLRDPTRRFVLTARDLALLNPNTRTCPVFRTRRDAELTKAIYRRVPVLIKEGPPAENPWGVRFATMFHMSNDSGLFRTRAQLEGAGWRLRGNVFERGGPNPPDPPSLKGRGEGTSLYIDTATGTIAPDPPSLKGRGEGGARGIFQPAPWQAEEQASPGHPFPSGKGPGVRSRYLPLYEAKLLHQFDHRWATYDGEETRDLTAAEKDDPNTLVMPRYWVPAEEVEARLGGKWERGWLLGWRDITNSTNERTVIAGVLPRVGVGDKFLLMFPALEPFDAAVLIANLDAYGFDYAARQKHGSTSLKYYIMKQLPVLPPSAFRGACPWIPDIPIRNWLAERVLELTYTACDLEAFARDLGYDGPPFRWDEARRFLLRCELDAAFFHLYGIERDDVDYILETFPIVREKDLKRYGEYRTKRVILEVYDAMRAAMDGGAPYRTRLDPPPGDRRAAHDVPSDWGHAS